ncbi:hypothetical protein HK096_003011, partial [Nowakowskiella sp. JEL0078]
MGSRLTSRSLKNISPSLFLSSSVLWDLFRHEISRLSVGLSALDIFRNFCLSSRFKKKNTVSFSAVNPEITKQIKAARDALAPLPGDIVFESLPNRGFGDAEIRKELQRYKEMDTSMWTPGKVSGIVYNSDVNLTALVTEASGMFALTNCAHPEIFRGTQRMESEIISMVLKMFKGPKDSCGNVTSGGTESILLAVKVYKDFAHEKRGITDPEMIVPITIHAAFEKAAEYFKVKLISIPYNTKSGKVDVGRIASAINRNTIL